MEQPWNRTQPNKFKTTCHRCGHQVQPGEGIVFLSCAGSRTWTGQHNECPEAGGMNEDNAWDEPARDWGDL